MGIQEIPCFLCGQEVQVKNTVKGKPYFICDPCGLQAFIRRQRGVDRLKDWMEGNGSSGSSSPSPRKGILFKGKGGGLILEWVNQLEVLKEKLGEIEDRKGIFPNEDTKFVIAALKAEIEGVKGQIKQGLRRKGKLRN